MEVTYETYDAMRREFLNRHNNEWHVDTTCIDENSCWSKNYICDDGAVWYESYRPVFETAVAEIHGCKVKTTVKFLVTEFWSSDDSKSRKYFEIY